LRKVGLRVNYPANVKDRDNILVGKPADCEKRNGGVQFAILNFQKGPRWEGRTQESWTIGGGQLVGVEKSGVYSYENAKGKRSSSSFVDSRLGNS